MLITYQHYHVTDHLLFSEIENFLSVHECEYIINAARKSGLAESETTHKWRHQEFYVTDNNNDAKLDLSEVRPLMLLN